MSVSELLDRVSSEELTEWRLYFQILNSEHKQASAGPSL